MDRFPDLLIDAWREVGRHAGIQDTLDALAPQLASHVSVAGIWIRTIDLGRRAVDSVACAGMGGDGRRDVLDSAPFEALLAWCRKGELVRGPAARLRQRLGSVIPAGARGELLAGPLLADGVPLGLVVFSRRGRQPFAAAHERRAQALLDPLAAALANDRRTHELEALREAAEADRRALLSRLGRRDIGEVVVGAEGGLGGVMERVALVADSDVPVLLLGETGSGKEVVARALRNRSRRAAGPFLRVNCGAIPAGLIDSELFGHERGSFSGATSQRRGWFERADRGTLLLDEVGELPPDAQVRLLRVLQDGSFVRVGGEQPVHVDVRVIAATHRDLHAMARDGRFREDLWYRLAVFPIEIPPLRDRPEDIPALATHLVLRACERFGTRALAPTEADLELLAGYDWPGNVRELAAVVDRAVILGGGQRLEIAKALGTGLIRDGGIDRPERGRAPDATPSFRDEETVLPLDRAMARHIEAALKRSKGRIEGPGGAARLLEINPHTLRARMRRLGVDWRPFRGGEAERGRARSRG